MPSSCATTYSLVSETVDDAEVLLRRAVRTSTWVSAHQLLQTAVAVRTQGSVRSWAASVPVTPYTTGTTGTRR